MTDTSAGAWHPDPTGRHEHRWWDGIQWTDQVADGGVTSTDPMVAAPVPSATGSTSSSGPNFKIIGLVVAGAILIIVLVVVLAGGSGGSQRENVIDGCVAYGTPRSDCECIVDEWEAGGNSLDELEEVDRMIAEGSGDGSLADVPPELIDAVVACQ